MSELPYLPEHIHDIIAETASLTHEELGIFMRLRWALWDAGGYLPKHEVESIARGYQISPGLWARLTKAGRIVSNGRLLETLQRTRERRAKAVERASRAAGARWGKVENINGNNDTAYAPSIAQACQSKSKQQNLSIYETAAKILVERVGLRDLAARSQIAKWLVVVTEEELKQLLFNAERENLRGSAFVAVIDQHIRAVERSKKRGLTLPFGLDSVKTRA